VRVIPRKLALLPAGVALTLTLAAGATGAAGAAAVTPGAQPAPQTPITARASLPDIENDVMCTLCHEPLAVAQSPEAFAERDFISKLVAQGQTKPQIERALVAQYGPAVLALPPAHGFNLTLYILPPALLIAGLVTLAVALPRWRRRARAAATRSTAEPGVMPADAQRLESELARFDG